MTHWAEDHLVSIGEASEILGVHIDTLREWDKKGLLKSVRTSGNHRRYKIGDVRDLLIEKFKREASERNHYRRHKCHQYVIDKMNFMPHVFKIHKVVEDCLLVELAPSKSYWILKLLPQPMLDINDDHYDDEKDDKKFFDIYSEFERKQPHYALGRYEEEIEFEQVVELFDANHALWTVQDIPITNVCSKIIAMDWGLKLFGRAMIWV